MATAIDEQIKLRTQNIPTPNKSTTVGGVNLPTVQKPSPTNTTPVTNPTNTTQTTQNPILSTYDQQAITDYKSLWADANASGDKATMDYAHSQAEAIRSKYKYSGGNDGSQYLEIQSPEVINPLQADYDALQKQLLEQAEAQKKQQQAILDANYASTIQQINNNYALSVEEQERQKATVEQQYQEAINQIESDTYRQMEMNKVMSEQRGLSYSNQASATNQGTLSRSTQAKIKQANVRSQSLNDIAQRIATLTTQKNNDLTNAQSQYNAGILGANATVDAQTAQNQFNMGMNQYEYDRTIVREDALRTEDRAYADLQKYKDEQFQIRMNEDAQDFQIELLDATSEKELERMAKQNGYNVNMANLNYQNQLSLQNDAQTHSNLQMLAEQRWQEKMSKAESAGIGKDAVSWIEGYDATIGTILGDESLTEEERQKKVNSVVDVMKLNPNYMNMSDEEKAFVETWSKNYVTESKMTAVDWRKFNEVKFGIASESKVGELLKKFEGNVGSINPGTWDSTGGKSYGAFQFAGRQLANGSWIKGYSANNNEMAGFLNWLNTSSNMQTKNIGKILQSAKSKDGNKYGNNFDKTFKSISSSANSANFLALQEEYAKKEWYNPAVEKVKQKAGINVNTKSQALQEVLFSSAIQHGDTGGSNLIADAYRNVSKSAYFDIKEQERAVIKEVYRLRNARYTSQYPQLKTRYKEELQIALNMFDREVKK